MVAGERCRERSGHPGDRRALLLHQTAVKAGDAEMSPGHSSLENVEAPGERAFPVGEGGPEAGCSSAEKLLCLVTSEGRRIFKKDRIGIQMTCAREGGQ